MSESTLQETFQRGVRAARRGRNEAAQQLLKEVVEAEPQHEQAWLWLSRVTDEPAAKTDYLQRVVALNPNNQWAADQLAALAGGIPADAPAETAPLPPPAAPKTKIVELKCPSCAGSVTVHGGAGVKTVVCKYCGSVLDLTDEQHAILSRVKKGARPLKPIEPGMKATFGGKEYEVFGWLQYTGSDSEETWTWDEWLLVAEDHQALWLSYDPEVGFLLQERLETYKPFDPQTASYIDTPRGRAWIKERDVAKITALRGEFTWRASVGEYIAYLDAQANKLHFSVEYSDRELEVHAGPAIAEADVWRAFRRDDLVAKSNQLTESKARRRQVSRIALVFAVIGWVLTFFSVLTGQEVFDADVRLAPGERATRQVGPFEITKPGRVHRISLQAASLQTNSWALVSAWALDEKKTKFYLFAGSFWDEAGRDSDGPWHESDLKGSHLFKPATAGQYMLEITLEEAQPATMPVSVTVRIENGIWMLHYFVGLAVICTLLWFFVSPTAPKKMMELMQDD